MVAEVIQDSLNVWNSKLAEISTILLESPENFKGGTVWNVIVNVFDSMQAIGYALLVLFFVMGVVKTCGSFAEVKKPELALKLFIRFILAQTAITYGLDLMKSIFAIVIGITMKISDMVNIGGGMTTTMPQEMIDAVNNLGFVEGLLVSVVTLLGSIVIFVLSFVILFIVYGRFFKIYLFTAFAPIPLSSFAGEPTQSMGKTFLKSYLVVCLEGAIILLCCVIFSVLVSATPIIDANANIMVRVLGYLGEIIFNMLVLVGAVKLANSTIREMIGN